MARIYLLTHRLTHFSHLVSSLGYILKEAGDQDYGKHWAIVAKLDGQDDVIVCEMERDSSQSITGTIIPLCRRMTIEEVKNGRESRRIYYIGMADVDEAKLIQYSYDIPINYQNYSLVFKNCQDWVQLLCKRLNLEHLFEIIESENDNCEDYYIYEKFEGNHLDLMSEESLSYRSMAMIENKIDGVLKLARDVF